MYLFVLPISGTDSHEISKNSFELVIYFATASHEISKNGVS